MTRTVESSSWRRIPTVMEYQAPLVRDLHRISVFARPCTYLPTEPCEVTSSHLIAHAATIASIYDCFRRMRTHARWPGDFGP